ncbi:MAG: hypothetical protein ACTSRA_12645 [Promethearchaeota archaeon]
MRCPKTKLFFIAFFIRVLNASPAFDKINDETQRNMNETGSEGNAPPTENDKDRQGSAHTLHHESRVKY